MTVISDHHHHMSNNEEKEIGEWTFGKEIGKGSFAIVYHGWRTGNVSDMQSDSLI